MDLYASLMVTLVCLSTTFAGCPDKCTCDKESRPNTVVLHVKCDDLQHLPLEIITSDVTELVLYENNITVLSNVDKQVENITQLKFLDVSENKMSKIEVNSLRIFTSLEDLVLSYNNISNIPTELFQTLPNLNSLELEHNRHLILPEYGFNAKELTFLDISECNLKEIPLKFFDSMPNLMILYLQGNHISYLGPLTVTKFRKMEYVNLGHNNLTEFQSEFTLLSKEEIARIYLEGNPFKCDCHYRNGLALILLMPDVECVLPPPNKNPNSKETQHEFLKGLNCDENVVKSEAKTVPTNTSTLVPNSDISPSYNNSNESTTLNNTALDKAKGDNLADNEEKQHHHVFNSFTALWIVLCIVVVSVLFVVIVVKRKSLLKYSESLNQFVYNHI